ncbi:hypothetical protein ACPVPU_07395 [Sphingomonas sp. CJ99]
MRIAAVILEGEATPEAIARIRAELLDDQQLVVAPPSVRSIVERVAFETGQRGRLIIGPLRMATLVRARDAVAWIAGELGRSNAATARVLGNRDPSSVLVARRRAEARRGRDPAFRMLTDRLVEELGGRP